MNRIARDCYRLRTKGGFIPYIGQHPYNKSIDTYEQAVEKRKCFPDRDGILICHEEIYIYYEDDGTFVKEERLLSVVD